MLSMTSVHDSIPEVSIVVPIYNEFDNLPDLVARIDAAMRTQPLSYELIAVDDGSSDGSAKRLRELAEQNPWVRAVCLVRNYGQSSALQAGFDRVRGRYVVTLDADLQNEPGDIPLLLERRVGVLTAVLTSWRVVLAQPAIMAVWAFLIMGLSTLAMVPMMVGLPWLVPIVAHASWHAYRDLVDADDVPERA